MAEQHVLQAIGLRTSQNELGAAPSGGLTKAVNCMLLAPGLMGSRRGHPKLSYTFGTVGDEANTMAFFGTVPLVQYTDTDGNGALVRDTGSQFVLYPDVYDPPDVALLRMKFLEVASNAYFNTTKGVYRLDGEARVPVLSGGPRNWGVIFNDYLDAADGFLLAGYSVAYRIVFGTKDDHGQVYLGPPSSRLIVTNPGDTAIAAFGTLTFDTASGTVGGVVAGTSVTLSWNTSDVVTAALWAAAVNANGTLSPNFTAVALDNVVTVTANTAGTAGNATTLVASGTGVTASGATFSGGAASGAPLNVALDISLADTVPNSVFYQVYRSLSFPPTYTGSVQTPTEPNDELYLAQEGWFGENQIGDDGLTVVDTAPELFVRAQTPLYTNSARGNGIVTANAAPPFCKDLTWWDNRAWYANVHYYQTALLTLVGCGPGANGQTGLRIGDQIAFGDEVLTAAANESVVDATFALTTTGTPSENVYATVLSLLYVLNQRLNCFAVSLAGSLSGAEGKFKYESAAYDDPVIQFAATTSKFTLSALTAVAGIVYATTSDPHGLQDGDTIALESATPDANFPVGTKTITDVNLGPTTFSYLLGTGYTGGSSGTYTERRLTPWTASAWRPSLPPAVFGIAIGDLHRGGASTVTATTDVAHNLSPGMSIQIEAVDTPDDHFSEGLFTVTSVPTTTTFTYVNDGAKNVSSETAYQSGGRYASSNNARPATVAPSKIQEQEAVPIVDEFGVGAFDVGLTDKAVLRIIPSKQYLYVLKEDGVYVISGVGGGPYRWDLVDDSVHVIGPDTAVVCNGTLVAVTNKGVVPITANGVGHPLTANKIEQELFQWFGPTLADTRLDAWACSRETDGLYILGLPALEGADAPYDEPTMLVYSTRADEWTGPWEKDWRFGLVRKSDDSLYFVSGLDGASTAPTLAVENNTKTALDYADDETALTVTAWDSATLTLTVTSTAGVTVGDAVGSAIVLEVTDATHLVLSGALTPTGHTVGGVVNGTTSTVTSATSDVATAAALAAHTNSTVAASVATAVAASNVVTLTAGSGFTGAAGNALTLVASGTGVTASGAVFSGGTDATYDTWTITVTPGFGADVGVEIFYAINHPVSVPWNTDAATTAYDLAIAISVACTFLAVDTVLSNVITLISNTPGTTGNFIVAGPVGCAKDNTIPGENGADATATLTLAGTLATTAYEAFPIELQHIAETRPSPADMKTSREIDLHFRNRSFRKATLELSSDLVTTPQDTDFYPAQTVAQAAAGTVPDYTADTSLYPGAPVRPKKTRLGVGQVVARASYLNIGFKIREAYALWTLNGTTVVESPVSEKGQR